jgi:hypothetical protein
MTSHQAKRLARVLGAIAVGVATAARLHAAEVDPATLKPFCDEPFEADATGKICVAKAATLAAIETEAKCSGDSLKWTPAVAPATRGTCTAVAGAAPKPKCDPKVLGLKFKDGKCLLSTTPDEDAAADFFRDWAVGIAVIKPKIATVTDASVFDNKIRVNSVIRQQSALLVARHFYPWNPGRRCVDRGTFANTEEGRDTFFGGVKGFFSNCFGMMVAAATPTSGSTNGQIINFLGAGLAIGGGIVGTNAYNWHFGIGVGRKFNTKVLGDGWVEGAAPPAGETQVRYKEIDVHAEFVYFTFRW